ncbi:hypothetical protein SDC9_102099 [bioreactor metagenome]|uniref:Uncharacterized protein n=1 Tax=bioreactor metagenome TaxID=1076179 RepID=A0A645APW2_9ZZZZ
MNTSPMECQALARNAKLPDQIASPNFRLTNNKLATMVTRIVFSFLFIPHLIYRSSVGIDPGLLTRRFAVIVQYSHKHIHVFER